MKSSVSIPLIILSLAFLYAYININPKVGDYNLMALFQSQNCPPSHPESTPLVEKFLTGSSYAADRRNTGTDGLSIGQIVLLEDDNESHVTTCKTLVDNPMYDPSDDTYRTTVYYRVGNFYMVAMPVIQSTVMQEGEEVAVTGWSYLAILDNDLNHVQTVALNSRFSKSLASGNGAASP